MKVFVNFPITNKENTLTRFLSMDMAKRFRVKQKKVERIRENISVYKNKENV
jgi:hypothetical protein